MATATLKSITGVTDPIQELDVQAEELLYSEELGASARSARS
jgi:hypothetical protein